MLRLLVTYANNSSEIIDLTDAHVVKDLRSHFKDDKGHQSESVEILGYFKEHNNNNSTGE